MININDYTDAIEFLEDAEYFKAEFTLTELRQLTSYSDDFAIKQLLHDLLWRYGYVKEERQAETVYYKSNIYSSHKEDKELSYTKQALYLMECGMYNAVDDFYKAKLEKERAELEQRKKDLGFE